MWEGAIVMSVEGGSPRVMTWIRELMLRRMRSEFGTPCLRKCTCSVKIPDMAMVVEVSHDDVVITAVKKKLKVRCEIRWKTGYMEDENIMNVNRDIIMVAVIERCSVMASEGKSESEGMWMKGME